MVRLGVRGSKGRVNRRWNWTRGWPIASAAGLMALLLYSPHAGSEDHEPTDAALQQLLAQHSCPCGCETRLPGGGRHPECFGCSVGKTEATFIREGIAAGG